MSRLKRIEELTRKAMVQNPATRNDDDICYLEVIRLCGIDVDAIPLGTFFRGRGTSCVPPFETVRRTRQKIQADDPNLRSTDIVTAKRRGQIEEYREYALNG